ncbi:MULTISPECIES: hypothetical protein [Rhodococcus]|uniref:hypothetical protein n=1 Tax=Nocardiaceae TaxID=85025 RepID=UPI00069090D6|nr:MULTISPECIES: hypothetical protein [Rhodococcus]
MTARAGRVRRRGVIRDAYGSPASEAFMVVAIATILITRAYLEATHYPQVGGKSLHIAHALYGGAAMMLALLVGWMFIGFGVRVFTVLLGGVGFGLFLDEVGKFVTKDNDYFYGPSSEIMYVLVVLLLVFSRIVREFRRPSRGESLANAAAIAADGVGHGLPDHRRDWALRMLVRAEAEGADPDTVAGIRMVLGTCGRSTSRTHSLRQFVPRLIPAFFTSARWVPVVGWGLVLISGAGVVFGIVELVLGDLHIDRRDLTIDVDGMGIASGILFVSACITFASALPAMLRLRKDGPLWPLRTLRVSALIFTLLNALVDFAQEGFTALGNVAIGLFALAVISHRITVRTTEIMENSVVLQEDRDSDCSRTVGSDQ